MKPEAKTVDESRVETVHIVRPNHLNGANRLFGGILMQWIDEVAGIVAKRHSMSNVTTASVDNLTFLHGAYQNDLIVIKGKMTWVGSTSMEVCVDTYVENPTGERHRINNAHFMMVALDENDKPVQVPRLILQTEDEHLAWAHGEERRRIRIQRRKDKLDGIYHKNPQPDGWGFLHQWIFTGGFPLLMVRALVLPSGRISPANSRERLVSAGPTSS